MGVALPSLTKAMFGGEAFPPSLRDWFLERGIAGYQCYATADLGLIAYETSAREGLVLDEGVIVEIVRPGTGDPVPEGEVGELVVTSLNPDYPLIRFGTGDLSAVLPALPHRAHQHAHQGLDGPRRPDHQDARHVRAPRPGPTSSSAFPRWRGAAGRQRRNGQRQMTLKVETACSGPRAWPPSVGEAIRDVTKLRGRRGGGLPGSLPNDGKVIEDARSYK
jgi:phenylacetate-CoA ligase